MASVEKQSSSSDGTLISEEKIVISGIAGLYPNSHNLKELSEILYNKVNPIEKVDRWSNSNMPELSHYIGQIPDLAFFDAQFFKVHYRLCELMDPMSRKLLEQTYQALFDAGQSPEELSGQKVGVFVGNCISESEKTIFYVFKSKSGLGIAGCSRSMFANRISYYLNLKGPSVTVDESCCSSIAAIEMAYNAINRGDCDSAIVGASNLCLHPHSIVHYGRVIDISMDGKTKSFDANADGCSKSEAVNVIYLQKAKDARRIYAYVVRAKSEYMPLPIQETDANGGFYRNPADFSRFLKTFYEEINVSPKDVQYIEAFGAASRECDKMELDTIDEIFCKDRSKALMVGSVTSNIGYVNAASGITAITKVLLGYHFGKLAGNLHYKTPRNDIAAIREGRIEILSDNKELIPSYTAVNGLSLTGNIAHVLLKGYNKQKNLSRYKSTFPRIVLCSGRQESSVKKIFDDLKSRPIDPEEIALLHRFHEFNVSGHLGRGFLILDTNKDGETVSVSEQCTYFDQGRRPLWFVYSGMGSQWTGMGKDLMRIPVFAAAIERCDRVLKPKGIDIVDIITSDDKNIFDNILHSFVGINAIQIGLTDILRAMSIEPDNIIGHSLGEMACAYADGCLTAEEAILCAYSRGLVSVQTKFIHGSMAAVGLGYEKISKIIPPEIEVACHNSPESSTISGPADIMNRFVSSLTSKGIFAKEVPCSNIAYHSRYIAEAGPRFLKYMKEIITSPRPRSERWLSTSIPRERWDEPLAKYSSAEYHTNNLLNPVLFEETAQLIPPDAVLIEVAPHGLLQAILKRSLPQSCSLLPLTRREHPQNSTLVLEVVGSLYLKGFNPKVRCIYPEVEFPVSTSTPMLSHLVDWVYQEKWSLALPTAANKKSATLSQNTISTYDNEHSYLKGHIIRGKNLYPFSAALVAVWDTLAMSLNRTPKSLSVQFKDVHFYTQPIMHKQRQLHVYVAVQKGTGYFEVLNDNSLMMTGHVIPEINNDLAIEAQNVETLRTNISASDVYKLLHAKEYQYVDQFLSIHSVNETLTDAKIKWTNNWVTFLDGLLQLNILRRKHHTVSKLNFVRNLSINVDEHCHGNTITKNEALLNAKVSDFKDITICGGVMMENLKFIDLPQHNEQEIILKSCEFVPLFPKETTNITRTMHSFIQIVADNIKKDSINIAEIINYDTVVSEYKDIKNIVANVTGVKVNYRKIYSMSSKTQEALKDVDVLLVADLLNNEKMCQKFKSFLKEDTFIINKHVTKQPDVSLYQVVSAHNVGCARIELAMWSPSKSSKLTIRIPQGKTIQNTQGGEYYLPLEDTSNPELGATLKIKRVGDLDSLYWVEAMPIDVKGIDIKVDYIGVNTVYVNKLLGSFFNENEKRNKSVIDFSGVSKRGTRLMGLLQSDAISTRLDASPELLWPVPDHWTQEDAATVPLAYSMAFYYLFIKAQIKSHYTICVEGGAGALGQAIISIALAHGCKVFVTVSKSSKKQLLQKIFPQLKSEQIIENVKGLCFVDTILSATEGRGCDVIISCAKGHFKTFCLHCLGFNGILIDTAIIHEHEDYKFGMNYLTKQRAYLPCDFTTIFQSKFEEEVKFIRVLMIDGIRRGYVKPLTRLTYEAQEAARAFRLQSACNNRGRVLLNLQNLQLHIEPRIRCSSFSWQLIISDNDILSLKLTEKLMKRGAKKIIVVLNSFSGCAEVQKRQWKEQGIKLNIITASKMASNISDIMKNCKEDGSLESIFMIASDPKSANVFESVENFAAVVSTCTSLKNFSLITTSHLSGKSKTWFVDEKLSKIFKKIVLPDILVTYGDSKSDIKNMVFVNNAVDALERALCLQKKIILAHVSNAPRETLLEVIIKLADIKEFSSDFVLRDVNLDNSKLMAIQGYLRDVYDVALDMKDILNLSTETINQLENNLTEHDFVTNQGVSSYFPKLHTDELLYSAEMIFMPTLEYSSMKITDLDMKKTHLIIIPGVEGHFEHFYTLCERLKLPAIVLQPDLDKPMMTVTDQATRYINIMKKKAVMLSNNFYLLGYEAGVPVALKMASLLENEGLMGTVFCIGGTPTEVIEDFKNSFKGCKSDEELQMEVIKHAYSLLTKEDPEILNILCQNKSWSEKVNICMDKLRGKLQYSIQYTRKWINMMYEKLSLLLKSTPEIHKLKSEVISLRPQYSTSSISSLQDYSEKKVKSYQIEAPLHFAHLDLMCASIINSNLDRDTLDKFHNRNICQKYTILNELVTV